MVASSPLGLSPSPGGSRRGRAGRSRGSLLLRLGAMPALLALLLSLLLPLAVLAQDEDEETDAEAGEPPAGEYTVAITEDDIPSDLVNGPDLIGRWQIFLRPDGSYALARADLGEVVTGTYTVDGDTITVTDESGLLSCINALPTGGEGVSPESGTYTWELDEDAGLTLRPIEEGCAGRRLLLSTRPLDFWVACLTEAMAIPPPVTGDEDATPAGEEGEEGEGEEGIRDPFGDDDEADDEEEEDEEQPDEDVDIDEDEAEDGIDAVLAQLSACWTTQDPARILPLFGSEFIAALVEQAGSLYDVAGIFDQIMAIPINWERAGEIEIDGVNATCLVSQTIGAEESFVRFQFVFEDGTWKLNSFG